MCNLQTRLAKVSRDWSVADEMLLSTFSMVYTTCNTYMLVLGIAQRWEHVLDAYLAIPEH
jgi:hypothetical protein